MIHLFGEDFRLEYLVFGSAQSLDLDIMVWIPANLTTLKSHRYVEASKVVESMVQSEKVVNASFAHYDQNGLSWCQKGSLGETGNSILDTYHLHAQMVPLPWTQRLPRNVPLKIMSSIRMIIGKLSRTSLSRPVLDQFIFLYIQDPLFDRKHLGSIFGGPSQNNQCRNVLIKRIQSVEEVSRILDMLDSDDLFRHLIRTTMRMRTLGMALHILKVDLTQLEWPKPPVDRLKTIAFQLGQSLALIEGVELFDKAEVAKKYPRLKKFIWRQPGDLTDLNWMLSEFIQAIQEYGLPLNATELDY